MQTIQAQESPILLFPKGAPGETTKLVEKASRNGGKVGGETVLRVTNVSEPTITIYQAPEEVAMGSAMIVCLCPSSCVCSMFRRQMRVVCLIPLHGVAVAAALVVFERVSKCGGITAEREVVARVGSQHQLARHVEAVEVTPKGCRCH